MLIKEEINNAKVVTIIDQLFSFNIKIHFPRNIVDGGNPPRLILNVIELGQTRVLTNVPVSFLRSSIIMKTTER
jgi:hypothetical protein